MKIICVSLLCLAIFDRSCAFDVNAYGYIKDLMNAVTVALVQREVEVPYTPYVIEFLSEGSIYHLMLPEGGIYGAVPSGNLLGNVTWWGDSRAFGVYCEFLIGDHSVPMVEEGKYEEGRDERRKEEESRGEEDGHEEYKTYYTGTVGALNGNTFNITITTNVTGFELSTYKGFVQNGTTYSLPTHILDTITKGNVTYTVNAPGASDQLSADTLATVQYVDLLVLRNNFLNFLTDYVLAVMHQVDIDDYVTSL
ncbi:unnamed protein product [Timema podura]|uniref:Uncharacterized protein n=1 Tax=Timema podura TaxID=61482 RepID=A0ABN7NXG9_TIMPD|nr:unnamed protein product [Timema podura]